MGDPFRIGGIESVTGPVERQQVCRVDFVRQRSAVLDRVCV
ncbi:MAG TPA: hypothetical protein VEF89_18850 [Solirubrobacteraceae bacterium]|nr:hypothetical protein [Solirubrobacteraceae bacterium]